MSLYHIIYDFLSNNIIKVTMDTSDYAYTLFQVTSNIGGRSLPFSSWLCHSLTICILVLVLVVLLLIVRWIFRVMAGLIRV